MTSRYRIKFGSLTIGKSDNHKTLTIGNTELEETETYKYLGMTLNNKGTLQNHIEDIKGKVHIATQTIVNVATYQDYRAIEMQIIWKLYKTCIVPIITYSVEAWNPTAEEYRQLKDIQNTALRNILDTNNKTPIGNSSTPNTIRATNNKGKKSTKYKSTTKRRRSEQTTQNS